MATHFTETNFLRGRTPSAILVITLTGIIWTPLWPAQPTSSSQGPDWQAAAGGRMMFDVATVKKNTTGPNFSRSSSFPLGPGDVYIPNAGRFQARNLTLLTYIKFAYKLSGDQEQFLLPQLPKWATTDRFDIQSSVQGNPTKDQMRLMMQSLLAERFKLAVHYETRQIPMYALLLDIPGKLGPLLQQHPSDSPCATTPWVPSPPPTAPPQLIDARFPASCGGILHMPPTVRGRVGAGARDVPMELM